MFCKNCGAEFQEGASFCPKCGQKIDIDEVNENEMDESEMEKLANESMPKKKSKKWILWVVLGIIGFLLLIGIIGAVSAENSYHGSYYDPDDPFSSSKVSVSDVKISRWSVNGVEKGKMACLKINRSTFQSAPYKDIKAVIDYGKTLEEIDRLAIEFDDGYGLCITYEDDGPEILYGRYDGVGRIKSVDARVLDMGSYYATGRKKVVTDGTWDWHYENEPDTTSKSPYGINGLI